MSKVPRPETGSAAFGVCGVGQKRIHFFRSLGALWKLRRSAGAGSLRDEGPGLSLITLWSGAGRSPLVPLYFPVEQQFAGIGGGLYCPYSRPVPLVRGSFS